MNRNILNDRFQIASDRWLDQPNALELIDRHDSLNKDESILLKKFFIDGYCIFPSELSNENLQSAIIDSQNFWINKPADLLAADTKINNGRPMPLSLFNKDFLPRPGTRILDSHSHSSALSEIISLPKLHRMVELILGEPPVATQSLYFSHGSTQALHRDPWYVVTTPVSTLCAAWVALEDILVESGPLQYVPKSHRLPYLPLNTGDIIFHDPKASPESKSLHIQHMRDSISTHNLEVKQFLAKKGDILLWHGSLIHGGSIVSDPKASRESFVIHFDASRVHHRHAQNVKIDNGFSKIFETKEILKKNNCNYFANPVKGLPETTWRS